MKIGIIDCGGANLNSIYYSFKRIGIDSFISNTVKDLSLADGYILPGVGSAGKVMENLNSNNLINFIQDTNKPTLGICIGMQILFEHSEEDDTDCLGIFNGNVKQFDSVNDLPVPQMGWNLVNSGSDNRFNGYYYFANSYYAETSSNTIAKCNYGVEYSAIVKKDNYLGCQFHPEKSSNIGEQFLKIFLEQL
jgi:glutamine amidotransferase